MAQTSRAVRKMRRLKRARTLAYRMTDIALKQRDQARMVASTLEEALKKYLPETVTEMVKDEVGKPDLVVRHVEDEMAPVKNEVSPVE